MCVEGCTFVSVSTPESDTSCHSSQPLLCSNNSIKGEGTPGTFSSFYFCFSYFSQITNTYFHPLFFSQTIKLWKSQVGFFVTLYFTNDLCTVSWFNPVQTSPSYHCCLNTCIIYLLSLLTQSTDVSCFTHVNNLQQMLHAFPFCCR